MFNNLYNINFKELTNNFSLYYVKYITIFLILFFVVSMITFIIVSYFVLKFLKLSLDNNNILFYQYNKKSQKLLDLYGNCKLTKIYLVRQPFSKFITFLLNVFMKN
jgi:hypothetical protein